MARNDTADDFIHANEEYVKLRAGRPHGEAVRELPQRQAVGGRGHDRPLLESWTTPELREHAFRLGVPHADDLDREPLIEAIFTRQAPRASSELDGRNR